MHCKIIAHRGESYDAPENTMSSINLAWERNADAVEVDVHLSVDNRIVVIHDSTTKRTGGKNEKVKNQTLAELKEIDIGSWKGKQFIGERIPVIEEVLNTIPSKKSLIIEIKSHKKLLPFLKKEIENSEVGISQIEIISFDYSTVKTAKNMFPDAKVLYLSNLDYSWLTKISNSKVDKLIKKTVAAGLDGLNVWAGNLLNEEFVQKVKYAGLSLYVWTVNDPILSKLLISWGIDGITTDRAAWLKNQILE